MPVQWDPTDFFLWFEMTPWLWTSFALFVLLVDLALDELKEKAARLEGSALDIEKEMDRLYKKAEEKSDFSALSAANGLREKMKENRLKLKETNDQISQKRDEMQF